jgi:NADH:ubiquinone oxidoreductase subunit K
MKKILFGKKNYIFLLISVFIILLGFILMSGGGSDNPEIFNPEIFNFTRIRLAPTIVLIGFGVAIYSILLKDKNNK